MVLVRAERSYTNIIQEIYDITAPQASAQKLQGQANCWLAECYQTRSTHRGIMTRESRTYQEFRTREYPGRPANCTRLYNASKCKRASILPKGKHEAHFAVSHDSWAALNDDTHKSRNSLKGHQHYGLRGRERATNSGFSTKPTSERPKRQLISRAVGTVLSLRRHPIKLERYREDQHGPCARMTRTNREMVQIFLRFYALVPGRLTGTPLTVISLAHMPLKDSFQALPTSAVLHEGPKSLCTFTCHSLASSFLLAYMPSASLFFFLGSYSPSGP